MTIQTSAQDVLSEIEFELAQGTVSRDDLGKAVQEVRQFHGKLRADIFNTPTQSLDVREIVNRQFQLNDMMLTLIGEMSAALHDTQLRVSRVHALTPVGGHATHAALNATLATLPHGDDLVNVAMPEPPVPAWDDATVSALKEAADEPLAQKIDVRPVGTPIIGGVLTRLRSALHEVILFYVNRLARRQSRVNSVYGEQLLALKRKSEVQEAQINKLARVVESGE